MPCPRWSLSPTRPSGSASAIISPLWPSRRSSECPQGVQPPLCLPLDALTDLEGSEDAPIVLEASGANQVAARWEDRGIPQVREFPVTEFARLPPFPGLPDSWEPCPAGTLDMLAEAAATTDGGSTRYALGCLQLRGATGEVIATDGRQILVQGGFAFPWDVDLLVPPTSLFGGRGLPHDQPVQIGRTESHVALRIGDWTLWLTIRTDARYPRIADVIPDERVPMIRLQLAPEDATFLDQGLERLPGREALYAPVTLDLNGQVSGAGPGRSVEARSTELVLAHSRYLGEPVRVSTSRYYLARALRLGFTEVQVQSPSDPILCRDRHRVFLWQPLSKDSAIESDQLRPSASSPPLQLRPLGRPSTSEENTHGPEEAQARPPAERADRREHARPRAKRRAPNGTGLAALSQEAVEIQRTLVEAKRRTGRLIGALRRERKSIACCKHALATLRQTPPAGGCGIARSMLALRTVSSHN